jgi:tetratricopeptide (TPR) repeat protein
MRRLLPIVVVALASSVSAQAPDPAELVKRGRALVNEGKLEEAARLYQQAIKINPQLSDARLAMGIVLDLQGQYAEARLHLTEAINGAPAGPARNQAMNAMAISYAFESKAAEAMKFIAPVYRQQATDRDHAGAAASANFMGRLYLESGDVANARKWYTDGYDHARKIEGLPPAETDLWELRWLHAQARLSAREGKADEARKHLSAFQQVMTRRNKAADDEEISRYLLGYVAYYAKDYDRAIAELTKGNLADPFIVNLLAMSYEAKGDHASAQQYFKRTLEINAHTLNNAVARPYAKSRIR